MALERRLAGDVQRDRVVKTGRISWSGHVYNLHTEEGWYASDSHIVSNCDCGVHPNTDADPFDEAGSAALLEAAHDAIQERLGVIDRGARAPDYRKLLLVKEHGELGPTLTVRGQHFDGPSAVA